MSLTVIYVINAITGIIGGGIGKSHSTLSGLLTFIQFLVLIGTGIYTGIVYTWQNVLIVIAISLGLGMFFASIRGSINGLLRRRNRY